MLSSNENERDGQHSGKHGGQQPHDDNEYEDDFVSHVSGSDVESISEESTHEIKIAPQTRDVAEATVSSLPSQIKEHREEDVVSSSQAYEDDFHSSSEHIDHESHPGDPPDHVSEIPDMTHPAPTRSLSPSPSPTPTPIPTRSPTRSLSPSPTPIPIPTRSPTRSLSPSPTHIPAPIALHAPSFHSEPTMSINHIDLIADHLWDDLIVDTVQCLSSTRLAVVRAARQEPVSLIRVDVAKRVSPLPASHIKDKEEEGEEDGQSERSTREKEERVERLVADLERDLVEDTVSVVTAILSRRFDLDSMAEDRLESPRMSPSLSPLIADASPSLGSPQYGRSSSSLSQHHVVVHMSTEYVTDLIHQVHDL